MKIRMIEKEGFNENYALNEEKVIAEYTGKDVINVFDGQEYEMFEGYVETDSAEEAIYQFCNNLKRWKNYNKFFSRMEKDVDIEELMIENFNYGITSDSDYDYYDKWIYSIDEIQKDVWRIRLDVAKHFLTTADLAKEQIKEEIKKYIDHCYEYGNDRKFSDYVELNGNINVIERVKELVKLIQPDLENVCKKLEAFSA